MNSEWTLSDLQRELPAWQKKNFPGRAAYMPLLGIVEEVGELHEARTTEDMKDASADIVIFAVDFVNAMGFDIEELHRPAREASGYPCRPIVESVGRLAHAFLKHSQGIRGTPEQHLESMKTALCDLLAGVEARARGSFELLPVVRATWAEVSQRVWRCQGCGKGLTRQGSIYCSPTCELAP